MYNAPYEQQGETDDDDHRQGTGAATHIKMDCRPNKFKAAALAVVAANRMKAMVAEGVEKDAKEENRAGGGEEEAADIERTQLIRPLPPTSRSYRNLVAAFEVE